MKTKKYYENYLNEIPIPVDDLASEGGRIPDNAKYGAWLRRNDPIAFNVGYHEFVQSRNNPGRKGLRYRWFETFHDYQIQDTKTGESRGMGDGVDMFVDFEGEALSPGTKEFDMAMDDYVTNSQDEIAEAYFGNPPEPMRSARKRGH